MIDGFVMALVLACLVLLAAGLLATAINRPPGLPHLAGAALVEIAVLVQVLIAVVGLFAGARVDGLVLFIAYAAFAVVVLPLGALFAVEEKTRWSGVVLAVASLALLITLWRMSGVWIGSDA